MVYYSHMTSNTNSACPLMDFVQSYARVPCVSLGRGLAVLQRMGNWVRLAPIFPTTRIPFREKLVAPLSRQGCDVVRVRQKRRNVTTTTTIEYADGTSYRYAVPICSSSSSCFSSSLSPLPRRPSPQLRPACHQLPQLVDWCNEVCQSRIQGRPKQCQPHRG